MQGSHRLSRGALAVCLGAGIATLAISGLASGKLKQKSATIAVSGLTEPSSGAATCKRGQEAVAGGFFAGDADAGVPFVFDSVRQGKRSWAFELFGPDPGEATVYAYCDKREPGLKIKAATETLGANFVNQSVVARCKRGQEAVSGGFEAPFTELAVVASRRSSKRGWEAEFAGPEGAEVTAIAYCDKAEPGLKTKQASTTVAENETAAAVAKCKRRQELRAGGFEGELDVGATLQGIPLGSRREGKRRWEATAISTGGAPEITAYAYCDKKEKKS